jgi:hypothetical protein
MHKTHGIDCHWLSALFAALCSMLSSRADTSARWQQRDLDLRPLLHRIALHLQVDLAAHECQRRLQPWGSKKTGRAEST